jgi:hypothetical protein
MRLLWLSRFWLMPDVRLSAAASDVEIDDGVD